MSGKWTLREMDNEAWNRNEPVYKNPAPAFYIGYRLYLPTNTEMTAALLKQWMQFVRYHIHKWNRIE